MSSLICEHCGSNNVQSRGHAVYCKDCGKYQKKEKIREAFTENRKNNTAEVSAEIPRIMSDDELLKFLKVDRSQWTITKVVYGKSEGYRKDRQVEWDVRDGKVTYGRVRDTGKLLIKPLFSVKVYLEKKVNEIAARNETEWIKKEATAYAPKYKLIKRPKQKDAYLYEILMPDLQLGRLVLEEEAGAASSPDLYIKKAEKAIGELLAIPYPIERILFPIGNDFFNSNTAEGMTVHGTPQRDDVRWQRTYMLAKHMMINAVESMTTIAPVDILIIKGNHDEERIFYFGDTLASWFHKNPNVTIDNRPIGRKYYSYGKVLLGLAHGYYERDTKLDALMAHKVPDLWAKSVYREWHLGDKHHKKDTLIKTDEFENGVMVRIFRSLADPSVWEFDKGFDGSLRAAEGLLWHKERGLKAQFPVSM
jgi:uncharacterized Zn finger protein (UPF0148 family)